MAAARKAVDFARIASTLNLRGNTASQLQAFKKRNDDARRRVQQLEQLPTSVDFSGYRKILNNKAVVDDIEKQVSGYKLASYDVAKQIKALEGFESQAVGQAQETAKLVEAELKDLQATLKNMESARPFEECTVDDILKAEPAIEKKVEEMVKKGRWMPAGYKEKFGELSVL